MTTDKKQIIKRLAIFYVIAILPLVVVSITLSNVYEEPVYNDVIGNAPILGVVGTFCMLAPTLAVIITRLVTKEGFEDNYIHINFKGNVKYYIASLLVPLAYNVVNVLAVWLYMSKDKNFGEAFHFNAQQIAMVLLYLALSVIMFLPNFGEEWGWRGYMMPKLLKTMNKPAAVIVGGVLWGLWHAPLTIIGHNFGTDYPFYPWLGILVMCVMCVFMNALLTLVTERTKSIFPACFIHGINNNMGTTLLIPLFMTEKAMNEVMVVPIEAIAIAMSGIAITGVVSMILFFKKEKTE